MVRKLLVAALAVAMIAPAGVQAQPAPAPQSVFGQAPSDVASTATTAILVASDGREAQRVAVTSGGFAFASVPPGQYVVSLVDASGKEVARSCSTSASVDEARQADFTRPCKVPLAAAPLAGAAAAGAGLSSTALIAAGIAAAGIATAIVVTSNNRDSGAASPSR
jgi:hypothetical protein